MKRKTVATLIILIIMSYVTLTAIRVFCSPHPAFNSFLSIDINPPITTPGSVCIELTLKNPFSSEVHTFRVEIYVPLPFIKVIRSERSITLNRTEENFVVYALDPIKLNGGEHRTCRLYVTASLPRGVISMSYIIKVRLYLDNVVVSEYEKKVLVYNAPEISRVISDHTSYDDILDVTVKPSFILYYDNASICIRIKNPEKKKLNFQVEIVDYANGTFFDLYYRNSKLPRILHQKEKAVYLLPKVDLDHGESAGIIVVVRPHNLTYVMFSRYRIGVKLLINNIEVFEDDIFIDVGAIPKDIKIVNVSGVTNGEYLNISFQVVNVQGNESKDVIGALHIIGESEIKIIRKAGEGYKETIEATSRIISLMSILLTIIGFDAASGIADILSLSLDLIGLMTAQPYINASKLYPGDILEVTLKLSFANKSLSGANVIVLFLNKTYKAKEIENGVYRALIKTSPLDMSAWGKHVPLIVKAEKPKFKPFIEERTVYIERPYKLIVSTAISLLSLPLLIYSLMSISRKETKKEILERSLRVK